MSESAKGEKPTVSVVVPTRNRPEHAAACAREILRCTGMGELLFVDQSDGDATEKALAAIGDARIRCERSALRGATNGRNLGIDVSQGDVVAFTDDDCRVAPDWVSRIADLFRDDPEVAIVCGRVWVPDDLQKEGFAATFEPEQRVWLRRFPPPDRDWGITANFAVRRTAFAQIGKFDPFLGPGAPLLCGEEPDFLFRALKAGLKVINAKEVQVAHLGIRSFGAQSRSLSHMYGAGTAAALTKHIRLLDLDAARLYGQHLRLMAKRLTTNVLTGERPLGLRYSMSFLQGSLSSLRFRVDGDRRMYLRR